MRPRAPSLQPGPWIHSHRLHWSPPVNNMLLLCSASVTCLLHCFGDGKGNRSPRSSKRPCVQLTVASETCPVTKNWTSDSMWPSAFLFMVWPKFLLCTQGQYMQHHICLRHTAWRFVYLAFTSSKDASWEWLHLGHVFTHRGEQR